MASRSLGSLYIDLMMRTGKFESDAGRAAKIAEKRAKEIDRAFRDVGRRIGTALGVGITAAVGSLTALTVQSINYADQLDEMSQKLGISAAQLSKWAYVAKLSGTDLEGLNRGVILLSKNSASALDPTSKMGKLFDTLGIDVQDATGKLRSVESLLPEVADRFRALESDTLKTALATQIFGRSGAELLEFLKRGAGGITALENELESLGGVISDDTAKAAAEFKDELDRLKIVGMGLGTQIASQLLPVMKDLVVDLRSLIREGDLASNIVTVLSGAFRVGVGVLDGYTKAVAKTSVAIETMANLLVGLAEVQRNIGIGGLFNEGSVAAGVEKIKKALAEGDAALAAIHNPRVNPFANVTSSASLPGPSRDPTLERRLTGMLATGSGGVKKPKAQKSEAEKEAEALQRAYESMNEQLKEQVALFGQTGEAAKVRYEIEHGALQGLEEGKAKELRTNAERLDLMRDEEEVKKRLDEITKEREDAITRGIENAADMIKDMEFELALLGMTNEAREREIALRYAGADATDKQRRRIVELTEELREAAKADAMLMDFQNSLSDAFFQLGKDAGNAKDVVKDFFESIADMILRSIAENWAKQIADLFRSTGNQGQTGSSGKSGGSSWINAAINIFGSIFGGGKAAGGPVKAGMFYKVNEHGPEIFSSGGRDWLMTGNRDGMVIPNHALPQPAAAQRPTKLNVIAVFSREQLDQEVARFNKSPQGERTIVTTFNRSGATR